MAVAVEKGQLPLGKVGEAVAKDRRNDMIANAQFMQKCVDAGEALPGAMDEHFEDMTQATRAENEWSAVANRDDDPLKALIATWDHYAGGKPPMKDMFPEVAEGQDD